MHAQSHAVRNRNLKTLKRYSKAKRTRAPLIHERWSNINTAYAGHRNSLRSRRRPI